MNKNNICLNFSGEVPLSELGLAGTSPSGLIQTAIEMLHVDLGLPWWGAVVAGTVIYHVRNGVIVTYCLDYKYI